MRNENIEKREMEISKYRDQIVGKQETCKSEQDERTIQSEI